MLERLIMESAVLLIVDNNRLFREGLKRILCNRKFTIQNDVDSFGEALALMQTEKVRFDLVVGDPGADDQREYEAIDAIRQQFPDVKIVILTDKAATLRSETALRNGVVGFLSKEISSEALRHSLELVLMGEPVIPIVVVQRARCAISLAGARCVLPLAAPSEMIEHGVSSAAELVDADAVTLPDSLPAALAESELDMPVGLSGRENQILKCLVDGLSNKLIARELNMAEATVKVHLRALLRKLKAQNRTQAAIWAMKNASTLTRVKRHDVRHLESQSSLVKFDALAEVAAFERLPA
jgi:two-component system nitrate/nitrite response regulator NarL